jgi:hypothetical protein
MPLHRHHSLVLWTLRIIQEAVVSLHNESSSVPRAEAHQPGDQSEHLKEEKGKPVSFWDHHGIKSVIRSCWIFSRISLVISLFSGVESKFSNEAP